MLTCTTDKLEVLAKDDIYLFDSPDGKQYQCFSIRIKDGIYPLKFATSEQVYNFVEPGKSYSFDVSLNFYKGKCKPKFTAVL